RAPVIRRAVHASRPPVGDGRCGGTPRGRPSGAAVAPPLQLDVHMPLTHRARRAARRADADGHPGQTSDGAAVGAHEVWMLAVARTDVLPELEPPDVVAQVRTGGETSLGQVDQIAVDRRTVESLWCQVVDDVRVRHRGARLLEPPQHGEPRPRAAQPDGVNATAQAVDRRACRRATWHVRKATPRRETAQRERALPRQPPWLARRRLLGAWSVSRIAPPLAAGRASRYLRSAGATGCR